MGKTETVIFDSGDMTPSSWTLDSTNNRYMNSVTQTSTNITKISNARTTYPSNQIFCKISRETGATITNCLSPIYIPETFVESGKYKQIAAQFINDAVCHFTFTFPLQDGATIYYMISNVSAFLSYKYRVKIIALS